MGRKELYGSMLEGNVPGVNGIADGILTTDLGKWGATRNAEFAHDVLDDKLPDMAKLATGGLSSDLGKWAEIDKEIRKEMVKNNEKVLPDIAIAKETLVR